LAEGGASQEQTTSAHLSATHKTLNSDLQQNMRAAFLGMPSFYRLEIVESRPPTVRRAAFFAQRLENWLTASNHNHLKIAKILKSMSTQGWKLRLLRFSIVFANIYSKESARPGTSDEMFSFWQSTAVAVYVALLALVSSFLRVRSLFRICPKNHLTPANAGTFADNSSFFRSRMAEIT
jgi:hypothetical protein